MSAAARALGGLPDLYQRAGALVEVGTPPPEMSDQDYLRRPPGSRTVYELSPHLLRDRLTRAARFVRTRKTDGSEELVHCHPTGWLVAAVHAMLATHFPLAPGQANPNELPDAPDVR